MVASASIGVVAKPCVFHGRHTNFCWSNKNSHIFQTFRGKNSSFGKKLRSNPNFHHTSPINFPLFSPQKNSTFPQFVVAQTLQNPQKHMSFRFSHDFPMIFPLITHHPPVPSLRSAADVGSSALDLAAQTGGRRGQRLVALLLEAMADPNVGAIGDLVWNYILYRYILNI